MNKTQPPSLPLAGSVPRQTAWLLCPGFLAEAPLQTARQMPASQESLRRILNRDEHELQSSAPEQDSEVKSEGFEHGSSSDNTIQAPEICSRANTQGQKPQAGHTILLVTLPALRSGAEQIKDKATSSLPRVA